MKEKFFIGCLLVLLLVNSISPLQAQTWDERPSVSLTTQYEQNFTTGNWDGDLFYGQWQTQDDGVFGATDISSGYLQFVWITKRVLLSKLSYSAPYSIETKVSYAGGSNRGGMVIRAKPTSLDEVQEPAQGDPGFNSEGLAFYPTSDGDSMIIQFTGAYVTNNTPVTRIKAPKPAGVTTNLLTDTFRLRIEDYSTSIYAFIDGIPFVRIDLSGKSGTVYTSGTVHNADMTVAGTFSGMEVEETGKIAIAQRDAQLRLYTVKISSKTLKEQSITFDVINQKKINDAPFELSATASSELPVAFKLISGPAILSGDTVTLTGKTGIVTITATQGGDTAYYPANDVTRAFYVDDANAQIPSASSQDYVDNWVATDALGRQLPAYDEAGATRSNKYVGVFYYLWAGAHGNTVYDITKILAHYPSDPLSASNTAWGGVNAFHFWGEPEYGYFRSEDPWVIRHDLQMLSNAHVDFIYFDVTNAVTYMETVKTVCEVSMQMRAEGIYTPQIVFLTKSSSGKIMNNLYDEFYSNKLFQDLWFYWNGKPLILGDSTDTDLRTEVKDFFTIRYSWAWTDTKNNPNQWQWLDRYPQDYGWSTDPSIPEQIPVADAEHPTSTIGKSYHDGEEPAIDENYSTPYTGQGLYFAQQWKRALEVDPPVIMVTQWNEWLAQRFLATENGTYAGRSIKTGDTYFVDEFNEEFSRDIAPMKGGHTDNYYYQLVSNIRKFKGMTQPPEFSSPVTIHMDGNFAEWAAITPAFKDPVGDVMHRNFSGYDPTVNYTNTTGRNDIVESKVIYDNENIYFYVKTADNITPYTDPNWMLLFIDADRSKKTGWEGYDWMINKSPVSDSVTSLQCYSGNGWGASSDIKYRVNGNEMEISIPRALLNMEESKPEFYFHWADNPQNLNDITAFFTDGESAPDRRFNYNFSTSAIAYTPQTPYKEQTIPGTVQMEDFDNGDDAYRDSDIKNNGGAYRTDQSVDIKEKSTDEYYVTDMYNNEWLGYTVDVKAVGLFTATIYYSASLENQKISMAMNNDTVCKQLSFPKTGTENDWSSIDVDVRLTAGTQILKLLVDSANGGLNIDKIVFTEKDVVYPGDGTGLYQTFYNGDIGGRNWFTDSICSRIDSVVNHEWADGESPASGVRSTFWNARWSGFIEPLYSEEYTISIVANDLVRVWIDNQLVIDAWTSAGTDVTQQIKINLTAGEKVPIQIDYANKTGDGNIKLKWQSASQPSEVIPQSQLYPLTISNAVNETGLDGLPAIYPNPAHNIVHIKALASSKVTVYNLYGQLLYTNIISSGTLDINVNNWGPGIYIVKTESRNAMSTQKLIVE